MWVVKEVEARSWNRRLELGAVNNDDLDVMYEEIAGPRNVLSLSSNLLGREVPKSVIDRMLRVCFPACKSYPGMEMLIVCSTACEQWPVRVIVVEQNI